MDELEAINFELSLSKNVWDVILACKDWRGILCARIKKQLRPYQIPLSDKIIEFVLSEGILGNEISSLWARQCLSRGTVVQTSLGEIGFIEDVGFSTGIKSVWSAKFSNGLEIRTTPDHRFKTEKGWKTLGDLKEELDSGKYWRQSKVLLGNANVGTNVFDEDELVLLTYMLTDGSMRKNQSYKFTNTNMKLLSDFEARLKRRFGLLVKKYQKGEKGWDYLCTTPSHISGSNPFRNWVKEVEWYHDFPKAFLSLNKKQLALVLNRWVAADGTVSSYVDLLGTFTQSKILVFLLTTFGIRSYLKNAGSGIFRVTVTGTKNLMRFFEAIGPIYGKEKQSERIIQAARKESPRWRKNRVDSVRLKSVKFIGEEETFDQEVLPLHTQNADGFLVHNSGKTETVALTTLVLGSFHVLFLNENFACGLFAPVESMITHVTRNRVRQMYKMVKHWLERDAHLIQTTGEGYTAATFTLQNLVNDKELTIRSLSAGESASIIGETFGLLIIEQSELVDALKLKTDIFPMGAAKGGIRIMTGTTSPYFRNEYFREAIEKWNKDPKLNKSTSDWVEMVDWKEASKVAPIYARYVKREKEKLGEDSIEFRTQYGLEWVGTALKFVGWETLAVLEQEYQSLKERLRFFAIDVARAGDSTVVTVIELDGASIHILGWLEMEGLDFEQQIPRMVEFLKAYEPLRYGLIDIAGIGRPVYDMLKKKLWPWARLDAYYPTEGSNDEMYKAMDREYAHKRIFYPKTVEDGQKKNKAKFIEQMLDLERKYKGFTLKLEAPHIKGRHDDYPVSLAMAVYALKERAFKGGVVSLEF